VCSTAVCYRPTPIHRVDYSVDRDRRQCNLSTIHLLHRRPQFTREMITASNVKQHQQLAGDVGLYTATVLLIFVTTFVTIETLRDRTAVVEQRQAIRH